MKKTALALSIVLPVAGVLVASCSSSDEPAGQVVGQSGAGDSGVGGQNVKDGSAGTGGKGGGQGGSSVGGGGQGGSSVGGGGGEGGPDGGVDGTVDSGPDGCKVISATNLSGITGMQMFGLAGKVTPNLGGAAPDSLMGTFNESGTFSQTPGTYDLGKQTDPGTCDHCFAVFVDGTEAFSATKSFFQASGTIELTDVSSPPTEESVGSLKNVKFVEVESDLKTLVSNGECLYIDTLSWNTKFKPVDAGTPCQMANECGDPNESVCDPKTGTCQPLQCDYPDGQLKCAGDEVCRSQFLYTKGACYKKCAMFDAPKCPSGFQCEPVEFGSLEGMCLRIGTSAAGEPCDLPDISTGCVENYICSAEDFAFWCRERCDYFGGSPTCKAAGQYCIQGDICSAENGDSAAIGEPCKQEDGVNCGPSGQSYRGTCWTFDDASGVRCWQNCRPGDSDDCPADTACDPDALSCFPI